jgi:indole-3-glycerol phosphate synthase
MTILESILGKKREELTTLRTKRLPTPGPLRPIALDRGPTDPLRVIAEIKRRSPSAGPLSTRLSVAERASCYERAGASLVSVLCDETFFDGSFSHLLEARKSCTLPLLCKEFVLDEVQLDAARAYGADLVLLIVRCLDELTLASLHRAALARGLVPLVEVATLAEARVAEGIGASLIGVNARDLDTLQMNPTRAAEVLDALPDSVVRLHLSGIATPEAVSQLALTRADAALVGEVLMREDDPELRLRSLVQAGRTPQSRPSR